MGRIEKKTDYANWLTARIHLLKDWGQSKTKSIKIYIIAYNEAQYVTRLARKATETLCEMY